MTCEDWSDPDCEHPCPICLAHPRRQVASVIVHDEPLVIQWYCLECQTHWYYI